MKLVQLLAKELKEWPEGVDVYAQDPTGSVFPWTGSPDHDGEQWIISGAADFHMGVSRVIGGYSACDDHMTANVTKSQWQAEREKINKPKWIRHRGGKCPVADDVKVLYRMRSGTITSHGEPSSILSWDHSKSGADIMAYRVIEETKDQEIEEVKDTNLGALTYKLEIDAAEATKEIDSLVAKLGQIESPLKWRDAIIHCQAIIEDCEREIERNTQQLAHEGFLLIALITDVSACVPAVDMSDPENWQEGDIVVCVKEEGSCAVLAAGKEYALRISDGDLGLVDEEGDHMCACLTNGQLEFVRRP